MLLTNTEGAKQVPLHLHTYIVVGPTEDLKCPEAWANPLPMIGTVAWNLSNKLGWKKREMDARHKCWVPARPCSLLSWALIWVSSRDIAKAFTNLPSIRSYPNRIVLGPYLTIDIHCYNSCAESSRQLPRPTTKGAWNASPFTSNLNIVTGALRTYLQKSPAELPNPHIYERPPGRARFNAACRFGVWNSLASTYWNSRINFPCTVLYSVLYICIMWIKKLSFLSLILIRIPTLTGHTIS